MATPTEDRWLFVCAIVAAIAGAGALAWKFALPALHERQQIADAQELVGRQMRDPSSVQFRDAFVKADAVCGEVNGKNAYGAYVGFKHFIALDGKVALEPELPAEPLGPGVSAGSLRLWGERNEFHGAWMLRCQTPLPPLPPGLEPILPKP